MELSFASFDDGAGGTLFGSASVDFAISGIGDAQVLQLSNINAVYDLSNLIDVTRVTFEYFDGAGIENLSVNGAALVDEFENLDGAAFSLGGVDVFITRTNTVAFAHGEVILTGNVTDFSVGGQQFYVDNVCVTACLLYTSPSPRD